MASFTDLALRYVLADDEAEMRGIASSAATEIETSHATSTVVGNWASSIHDWMRGSGSTGDDLALSGQGDAADGGDIISRAKALGFLAATLEALDPATLKKDQVQRLCVFFGSMFSNDHKAGITASASALRQLVSAKSFRPELAVGILRDICKLGEDFRLQTPATRLDIYELILQLIRDPLVAAELKRQNGSFDKFATGLLHMCQHERDPRNLLVWFEIIRTLVAQYSPAPELLEDIFKAFAAYFPISIRSSATPLDVTAEDLKTAVRGCFSSCGTLAPFAFPFLIQKLDQSDAVTIAVKDDILRTIKACIDQYDGPEDSLVPYTEKIWACLKYEVRNGEVKETVDATLDVLRSIARRLYATSDQTPSASLLGKYIDLVFQDCREDLSNPTYTKQAGLLLITVTTSSAGALVTESRRLVDTLSQDLRQPKSPSHAADLLSLLNAFLGARAELVRDQLQSPTADLKPLEGEPLDHLRALFNQVYWPAWRESTAAQPNREQSAVLREVIRGLGALCCQQAIRPGGVPALLNPKAACTEVCSLFIHRILTGLTLSSNDHIELSGDLEEDMVLALRSVVMSYRDGFTALVESSKAAIESRDWRSPSAQSFKALKVLLARLAFIGCSELPSNVGTDPSATDTRSPLDNFVALTGSLLATIEALMEVKAAPAAVALLISGLHGAARNFSDACSPVPVENVGVLKLNAQSDWLDEFEHATADTRVSSDWSRLIAAHYGPSSRASSDAAPLMDESRQSPPLAKFVRLSLFTVRHVYRLFTQEPVVSNGKGTAPGLADPLLAYQQQGLSVDLPLYQLANMASFVIRGLSVESQRSYSLATEAFHLFRAPPSSSPFWSTGQDAILNLLTVGLLEPLWPDAMVELYKPSGAAQAVMCDTETSTKCSRRINQVRNSIVTILANKYRGGAGTADTERVSFKQVLGFWRLQLEKVPEAWGGSDSVFEAYSSRALSIMAGSIARQDKDTISLVPLIHEAIGSESVAGKTMAASMGILVQEKDCLGKSTHAVIKPLYRQWAYSHLVKPLYELALPVNRASPQAENYTVAILSILKHYPFAVYADDIEPLTRLLITSLLEIRTLPDLLATLKILHAVLCSEPDSLKEHIKPIVEAVVDVYHLTSRASQKTASRHDAMAPACRKSAVQLLGELPGRFEERYLLPHSPPMQRILAKASGDPVREVRRAALASREAWAKVA